MSPSATQQVKTCTLNAENVTHYFISYALSRMCNLWFYTLSQHQALSLELTEVSFSHRFFYLLHFTRKFRK